MPLSPIRFLTTLCLSLALATALAAEHDPAGDRYVGGKGKGPGKDVLPIEVVEPITYELMSANAENLEAVSGKGVSYSYVYVTVGDQTMAVDPFRFNR